MKSWKMAGRRLGLLLIILILLLGLNTADMTAYAKKADNLEVKTSYGYDEQTKPYQYVPVWLDITNNGKDFTGYVQFYIPYGREDKSYMVKKSVTIPEGETKTASVSIKISDVVQNIAYDIVNDAGDVEESGTVKLSASNISTDFLIGAITDDYTSLNMFDNISFTEGGSSILVQLDMNRLPDNWYSLAMLDMIVINNTSTEQMTEEQKQALLTWVENGGVLLIGTGEYGKKTTAAFQDSILTGDLGELQQVTIDGVVPVNSYNISLPDGKSILSDGTNNLIQVKKSGSGYIAVAGFDFGQENIAKHAAEVTGFLPDLFTNMLGSDKISSVFTYAQSGMNDYYDISNIITNNISGKVPKIRYFILVIFLYLISISPLLYFILKKRDKCKYSYIGIGGLSIVFSLVIYAMGTPTRFSEPFINYITIKELNNGLVNENTYLNMQAPDNSTYSTIYKSEYNVQPIADYLNGYYVEQSTKVNKEYSVSTNYKTSGTEVQIQDSGAFSNNLFYLNRTFTDKTGETVEINMHDYLSKVSGTITSKLSYTLEDAIIDYNGEIYNIGNLKPDESVKIEDCKIITYGGDYYTAASYVFPVVEGSSNSLQMKKQSILNYYYTTKYNSSIDKDAVYLLGFLKENKENFQTDQQIKANGLEMIKIPVTVDYTDGNTVYIPNIDTNPYILSGDFDTYSNVTYSDTVVLKYRVPDDYTVEQLIINDAVANNLMGSSAFSGQIEFYNNSTNSFELLDTSKKQFTPEELSNYVFTEDDSPVLEVRYECNTGGNGNCIQLPTISLVGRNE